MARAEASVAREELERLVHEYLHARDEHRRTRPGGRRRRRLDAHLLELEEQFERTLGSLPLEESTRVEWRDHLRGRAGAPESPPPEAALIRERGAFDHWPPAGSTIPVTVHVRGGIPAQARADLEQTLAGLGRLAPRPLLHARGTLERLRDPALPRPVVATGALDLGARAVRARVTAGTPAEAIDLLGSRLRRSLLEVAERDEAERRGGARNRSSSPPGGRRH